jgi:hypothetical protein
MKRGGAMIHFKNKNAMKSSKKVMKKDREEDDFDFEPTLDKRISMEELKKPIKNKGAMDSVISKMDKLKVKAPIAPQVKKRRKPIVLEL